MSADYIPANQGFNPDPNWKHSQGFGSKAGNHEKYAFEFKWFRIKRLRRFHFVLVALVILILPVLKEWNTLLYGYRVQGISVGEKLFDLGSGYYVQKNVQRTGISYTLEGNNNIVPAPDNITIPPGEKVPLLISKKDPEYYMIATIAGFYLQFNRAVKIVIVLIIWGAIFSTLLQIQKGKLSARSYH